MINLKYALWLGISTVAFAASPMIGPENPRNLRLLETAPMLFELHQVTVGDAPQYFAYPKRERDFIKNFTTSEKNALLYYDNQNGAAVAGKGGIFSDNVNVKQPSIGLATSLVGGMDFRGGETLKDTIWPGIDGGIYLRGFADSVDFVLDARIYSEGHSANYPQSYDGEFIEIQRDENNDGVEYLAMLVIEDI